MKLFQAHAGAHRSVLPRTLISLAPRPPAFLMESWCLSAGRSLASWQSHNEEDFCIVESFSRPGAEVKNVTDYIEMSGCSR